MEDLIKRNDAIKAINNYYKDECFDVQSENGRQHDNKMLSRAMKAIPSARPTGEWIKSNILPNGWHCSHCDSPVMTDDIEEMLYCPNCGADMRGEDDV